MSSELHTKSVQNPKISRRAFLTGSTAVGATLLTNPTALAQSNTEFDISYLWHPELDAVIDYHDAIASVLPGIANNLAIVKGAENYGLIWDRDFTTREQAARAAENHTRFLRSADLDAAALVEDEGYSRLYNVSFGSGPNLEALKRDFETVYGRLGTGIGSQLVIEELENGNYVLTYHRRGDLQSTRAAAVRLEGLLEGTGIGASHTLEKGRPIVHGESSYLDSIGRGEVIPEQRETDQEDLSVVEPIPQPPTQTVRGSLEVIIEDNVRERRERGTITPHDRTSVVVYDHTTGEKLVSINENVPRQAASMIKPPVALAFLHEAHRGRFVYGPRSRRQLERMIQRSSNSATNWAIRQVGGPEAVHRILQENYGGIFQQTEVVEYIPRGGRTYRNMMSAHDASRFLYAMMHNNFPGNIAPEIRRLMALPGRDRVYTGARRVPQGTLVYNKTGSTARMIGDMAVLVARDQNGGTKAYTIIGMIERDHRARNYGAFMRTMGNVIREWSNLTYEYLKPMHNLV